MGPSGRQAALLAPSAGSGSTLRGADAHAPMTRVVLGVGLTGPAEGAAAGRNRSARRRLRRRRGRRHRRAGSGRHAGRGRLRAGRRQGRPVVAESRLPRVAADCVVIGCDSMLYLDGALRGKPARRRGAHAASGSRWPARSGELYTGHCVIRLRDGAIASAVQPKPAVTTVHFGTPSPARPGRLLGSGEPTAGGGRLHARRPGRLVRRRRRRRSVATSSG